jgi:dipeptidyl aminopeptidase/acylaminoacyl peptidase
MPRVILLALFLAAGLPAEKLPFDVKALLSLTRISDPQLSPDGHTVAFAAQTIDIESNRGNTQIYVVPVSGGAPREITHEGNANSRPRWSPDSKRLAFVSDRGGSSQIWIMDADGANAHAVTSLATGADGVLYSHDGKNLVFASEVFPECTDEACNKRKLEAEKSAKVGARIYTSLLYRHWNEWSTSRRRHLFVVSIEGGTPKDLMSGLRDEPPFSLGGDDYTIAPDGGEVCYVLNPDPEPATSTNSELYVVPITGGESKKITVNPAADSNPQYSPDGRYLAYRAQTRPGYESDRWRLVTLERATGRVRTLTEGLDRWVGNFTWSPESSHLVFSTEDRGRSSLHMIPLAGGGARVIISGASTLGSPQFSPDGKTLIYTEHTGSHPIEIFRAASTGGTAVALTHLNDAQLDKHQLSPLEEFSVEGADKDRVHSFLIKPYGFHAGKKYPVLFLIHGGPQGAWGESWTYRWNAQVMAAAGYVVVMPNPRGSDGYGQKFMDDISGDWGGKAYEDIMAVVDHVAALPYADADRMAAAGGSYGGYMVNWILGHTNRFKALISHAGVFDLRSMFGATEELWFPLWEFKGTPWENPEAYTRWSPSYFVKDFHTPTLVIHGEQDFRVPYGQGLQLFTSLKMQKVPAKLLVFPDEGHWVTKPQNSLLWYKTFIEWLDEWTKQPAPAAPAATPAAPASK